MGRKAGMGTWPAQGVDWRVACPIRDDALLPPPHPPYLPSPLPPQVLRKEKETLSKKQKLVEQSMGAITQDMAEFQREKQVRGGGGKRVAW